MMNTKNRRKDVDEMNMGNEKEGERVARIVVMPPGPNAQKRIVEYESRVGTNNYKMHKLVLKEADGITLTDVDGNRYLDALTGVGVNVLGSKHPAIMKAVQGVLDKGYALPNNHVMYYQEYDELVAAVQSTLPSRLSNGGAFLSNSGTEANEAALKLAKNLTGKKSVIVSDRAFHGRTAGTLGGTTGNKGKKGMDLAIGGYYAFESPDPYRPPAGKDAAQNSLESIRNILKTKVSPSDVAAIMIEPVAGEQGVLTYQKEFYQGLNEIAQQNDIFIIADEVQSGMGKTGSWWASERLGLNADIITSAKALGGGVPLGGMFATREMFEKWEKGSHASTNGGQAMACAAGTAVIETIKRENLLENVKRIQDHMKSGFDKLAAKYEVIGDVRAAGALVGVELVQDRGTKVPLDAGPIDEAVFRRGLVASAAGTWHNVLRMSFAYNTPVSALDEVLGIYDAAFEEVVKK